MYVTYRTLLFVIIYIVFSTTAYADQDNKDVSPLSVEMTTWRVTQQDVIELAATTALPGDVLRYQVRYANISDGTLRNLQASVPVPDSTILSAVNTEQHLFASTDKKTFSTWPLVRTITRPDGREVEELVPLSEVRSVRWDVSNIPAKSDVVFYIDVQIVQ